MSSEHSHDADGRATLAHLQLLQSQFDSACGFDFPAADTEPHASLHRIEFAALALCGEAGEVANLVKKTRRATWLGRPSEPEPAALADELADVLAYTLKLANLLGVDLQESYERKMDQNRQRFGQPARVLTVMGPPGSGKSSAVKALAKRFPAYVEEPARNPMLRLLSWRTYDEALASQLWFLETLSRVIETADRAKPLVVDQDPRAIVAVYGSLLTEQGHLPIRAVEEMQALLVEVEAALGQWEAGRRTVLLDAEPDILAARVRQRDERSAGVDWLELVRSRFLVETSQLSEARILRTDEMAIDDVARELEDHLYAA